MNKPLIISLAFLVAGIASAAEGYSSKNATGTTSAAVIFPGGPPLRVTDYDVTADNATNTLVFQVGTVGTSVAIAAASTATNVTFRKNTFASNDVIVLQTAAENVTNATVWGATTSTNKLITLQRALGTNLAVGDGVFKVVDYAYTLLAPVAAAGTSCLLDRTNGIIAGSYLLDRGPGLPPKAADLSVIAGAARAQFPISPVAETDAAAATAVYEQLTNKLVSFASAGGAATNRLTVNLTNGITLNDLVLHESANGALTIYTVTNLDGTTNLLVSPLLAEAAAADDKVFVLHPTSYTVIFPATAGDRTLILSASTALASNDTIVVNATAHAWRTRLTAAVTATNIYTLTLAAGGFSAASLAGQAIYRITNSHLVSFAATASADQITLNNATNLSAGDRLLIQPASGGLFYNHLLGTAADDPVTAVSFTGAIGLSVAVNDTAWLLGSATSLPVGNATLRNSGAALFSADRGRPVRAVITGAAACKLNNVTVKYD